MAEIVEGVLIIGDNEIKCSACKRYKDKSEFGNNKARKNGLNSSCKVCNNLASSKVNESKSDRRRQIKKSLNRLLAIEKVVDIKYMVSINIVKTNIEQILSNSKIYARDVDNINEQVFGIMNYIKEINV